MKMTLNRMLKVLALFCVTVMGLATIVATSGDSGDTTATPETPPESGSIYLPSDGAAFVEGDNVSLIAQLDNLESGQTYTYSWVSGIDGEISTSASDTVTTLTAGTHDIILTVYDSSGNTVVSDSVTITVGEKDSSTTNKKPVVSITSPSTTLSFNVGVTILFSGTATDEEDGTLSGSSLVWSSSLDGVLVTGESVSINSATMSIGEHTITLTATDSDGATSSAFIIISIGSTSTAPTVTITSPVSGTEVQAGDTISFIGSATDNDGSAITGTNLEWISSKDGTIGTGGTLIIDSRYVSAIDGPLTEGTHTIYLWATGATGTGQATTSITLANTSPTATIINPPETCPETDTLCKTFAPGVWINFQGSATDPEDGTLSGESLEWKSHIDGLIGTGEILDIKTDNVPALGGAALSDGEHVITLEAKDGWGASGTDSIIITIGSNTPPVPTITYPTTDYTSTTSTGYVTFYGKAEDAEDGSLTSDSMEWYRTDQLDKLTPVEAPGSGLLTTSVRLDLSTFESGTHTITLVATDSHGEIGVTTRNITIP